MSITALLSILAFSTAVSGFTFSHTDPVECQNITLQWQGGVPPFYATVVPAYPLAGARIQNVSIPNVSSPNRSFSFRLDNPANLEFSIIMSDSTGWGAGGVTPVLQIAGSSDASCHTSVPPFGFYFYSNPTFSISTAQCQTLRLSWDNTVVYPLQALAFIPGGSAFTIPVPQTRSSLSTNWAVNIREGAQYQIMMADASGTASSGGSTNLTWVTAGTSSCLSPNSPGAGVRVATVISNGVSSTRSLTSLMSSSASSSSSSRAGEGNSGGGSTGSSGPTANAGAIAGGVVGGLAAMALLVFVLFCCRRRRRRAEQQRQDYNDAPSSATPVYQPEMRQAPTSLGPAAAVMRRATRSMGHSRQVSRSSFDILSEPTGVPSTPPRLETPIPADDMPNPFISPFPAPLPLPQSPSEEQPSTQAPVPWGAARGHNKETSTGTLDSLTPEAVARGSMHSGSLVPLNTGPTQNSSLNRNSRKLSGSFGETPPQSPTTRPTPQMRSPVQRAMSSSGLTRWSVDEDSEIGTVRRSAGSGDRLSEVVEGRGPASVETSSPGTTFIQHMDGGPGGVFELPPSYNQLRARNPDE